MKIKILLCLILITGAVLRLWGLGAVPASPDWDEAALGYNAYSLLQTGKDEYGHSFPMILQSFGDYKPALYAYLIIPFIPIFGLSDISVRLPSALFGIIAILATYFLVKELLNLKTKLKEEESKNEKKSVKFLIGDNLDKALPLLSAGLLAVSPWHIQFSRTAFESNVGLTWNILLVLCFIVGLRKNWVFVFSGLFAALSIYTYQSEKIFTPLLVFALTVIFSKELLQISKKYLFVAIVVGALVALPMVNFTLTDEHGLARARGTSIFSSQDDVLKYSIQKLEKDKSENNRLGMVLDNRRIEYFKLIFSGYLSHYDLKWLFITGDGERHHAPNMGLLYLWELPFLLLGIYCVIMSPWMRSYKKLKLIVFAWFLLAPVPAAITNDVPHAVRTLNFLPTFQIFIAIGIVRSFAYIKEVELASIKGRVIAYMLSLCTGILIFLNFLYYLDQYFIQQNYFYSQYWQYGYEDAVSYAAKHENEYEKIIVSDRNPLDQSYIFFLYYLQYPPREYQENRGKNHTFGKYEFRPIQWDTDKNSPKTLLIGLPGEFPENMKATHMVHYLDGKSAIKIVSIE